MSYKTYIAELKEYVMFDNREQKVIEFLKKNGPVSSGMIHDGVGLPLSYATIKRILAKLVSGRYLQIRGNGKGTKYLMSPFFDLIDPVDIDRYFEKEIDERTIKNTFSFDLISQVLPAYPLFTDSERSRLQELQNKYLVNLSQLTDSGYKKELERLAIDLSWKSSQIEGNTYTLLETERLLKERETAAGRTKEEAIMLLNHKDALYFIIENRDYLSPLSIAGIEDVHSILVKELEVSRNIRNRRVGISGTNYRPLDNAFQITEALESTCNLINQKEDSFEKALLALLLVSYIQPFMDGNKRTARLVSNAILISGNYCPLSFRTVDPIRFKMAMLLFYEQNNLSAIKAIFIDQVEFAVNTYF